MAVTKRIEVDSITEANKITLYPKSESIEFQYVNDVEGKKGRKSLTKEQILEVITPEAFAVMYSNLQLLADFANPDKVEDEAL